MSFISPKKILVVKNRALGDSIMGLSTLQYLKKCFPQAEIIYAIPSWIAPLYQNLDCAADSILPLLLNSWRDIPKLFSQITKLSPDIILELHQAGRTKNFFSLYSLLKNVPYFTHNHHLNRGGAVIDQGVIKPLIQRDLDGAWSHLIRHSDPDPSPPSYLDLPPQIKWREDKKTLTKKIILGIVATRQTKMWPLEFYHQLAQILLRDFPHLEIGIPLSKSAEDQLLRKRFEKMPLKHPQISPGEFSSRCQFIEVPLSQLPGELFAAQFYIGNDTGLKHLAVALGVPTFTLFGPEPPLEWHPYCQNRHPYYYREGLACRTQKYHYCALSNCDSMICLNNFTPENLIEKIALQLHACV